MVATRSPVFTFFLAMNPLPETSPSVAPKRRTRPRDTAQYGSRRSGSWRPGRPSQRRRRQLIDVIRWRVRIGAPRRDVPTYCGSWQAVYALFRLWQGAASGSRS
ncbi:transposase [Micromonospora echinaurantiaca]